MKCTTKGGNNFVGFLFQDDFSEDTNLGKSHQLDFSQFMGRLVQVHAADFHFVFACFEFEDSVSFS